MRRGEWTAMRFTPTVSWTKPSPLSHTHSTTHFSVTANSLRRNFASNFVPPAVRLQRRCGLPFTHLRWVVTASAHYEQSRLLTSAAITSPTGKPGISSAEAAFEAALYGDLTHPTVSVDDGSPDASAEVVQRDGDGATSQATRQATEQLSRQADITYMESLTSHTSSASGSLTTANTGHRRQSASSAEAALPPLCETTTPTTVTTKSHDPLFIVEPSQELPRKLSSSSEEAFERALYGDIFGTAGSLDELSHDAATADDATANESSAQDGAPVSAPSAAPFSRSLPPGIEPDARLVPPSATFNLATKVVTRSSSNVAAAEAAFERALYGLEVDPAEAQAAEVVSDAATEVSVNSTADDSPRAGVFADSAAAQPTNGVSPPVRAELEEDSQQDLQFNPPQPSSAEEKGIALDDPSDEQHGERDVDAEDGHDHELLEELFETDDEDITGYGPPATLVATAQRPQESENEKTAVKHKPAETTAAEEDADIDPLEPPPAPTVSMSCPLRVEDYDTSSGDRFALADALFNLTDRHTTVVTHLDPVDRVEFNMPLLDRPSKLNLFYYSGWLSQLQERENVTAGGTAVGSQSTQGEGTVAVAPEEPPTHREVVGRSKVLRCLVYRFLRTPHLWWDQVVELVWLATKDAREVEARRDTADQQSACTAKMSDENGDESGGDDGGRASLSHSMSEALLRSAMTRIFGTRPLDVHFFSYALRCELADMYNASLHPTTANVFSGPAATWKAFLLTHRLDKTRVCGPHVKPFSYGEFRPTITAAELTPLRFCDAEASWYADRDAHAAPRGGGNAQLSSTDASLDTSLPPSAASVDSAASAGHPWEVMSEVERNAFLFGKESARLSAQLYSADGIFVVYGQNGRSFEEESKLAAAEEALRREAEDDERAAAAAASRRTPLERAQAEEMAQVRLYDVDRVVWELANADGSGNACVNATTGVVTSNFLTRVAFPPASLMSSRGAAGGGRGRGARARRQARTTSPFQLQLQNKEDVQLAALWQRFANASTGDLVDNLVHVQRQSQQLVLEAAADLAVQKAFWLLFYTRDEVRAVTDPRRTYATAWALHRELLELLSPITASAASTSSTYPTSRANNAAADKASAVPPAFARLSLTSQVSYACFGCAHIPVQRVTAVPRDDTASSETMLSAVSPAETPSALYDAIREVSSRVSTGGDVEGVEIDLDHDIVQATSAFESLSPLQQLAVGFCFPQNASERLEKARAHASRTECAVSSISAANDVDGASVTPEEIASLLAPPPNAPLAPRTRSKHAARIAEWMRIGVEHLAAAAQEKMEDGTAAAAAEEQQHRHVAAPSLTIAATLSPPGGEQRQTEDDELAFAEEVDNSSDAAGLQSKDAGDGDLNTPVASVATPALPPAESAALVRKTSARQHTQEALEASVYRCLCALRAAGVLASLTTPPDNAAALLTAVQQRAVHDAVQRIVTSLEKTAEVSECPDTSTVREAEDTAAGPREGSGDDVCADDDTAAPAQTDAEEEGEASVEEEEEVVRAPKRRGRRGRRPASTRDSSAEAAEDNASTQDEQPPAPSARSVAKRNLLAKETPLEEPTAVRRRGRPRRNVNADGANHKVKYNTHRDRSMRSVRKAGKRKRASNAVFFM